ncbi:uncharacterized protein LDX57_010778 [Aspergillus melleus]|uniref:uncharacterized protein n=1 Tax=Aspergillus melleus TaxID=138277 RepID=UPI001E8D9F64|nr:uncharacterized protein LDX57_010778 [Aspergillus melleus]KAH8433144.1 hypothetical protein LDX57_010778 [Aspergillus melleus]
MAGDISRTLPKLKSSSKNSSIAAEKVTGDNIAHGNWKAGRGMEWIDLAYGQTTDLVIGSALCPKVKHFKDFNGEKLSNYCVGSDLGVRWEGPKDVQLIHSTSVLSGVQSEPNGASGKFDT